MLPISEELKIIQASTTAEERAQRVQHLQHRLHEDEMRRKLRNVRLISSVERLAERAASLRELTDRLRLIKRQYEVLATHLPDDEQGDQSQHGEPATSVRNSQSATSVGEAQLHRQMIAAQTGFHPAGAGDLASGSHHLVEGYYDPRLAARGWQGGVDPWGPAGQQLGRDELGRSTESRAALLRSRIATSVTVRSDPPPPPPPGGRWENYPPAATGAMSVAEAWDRNGASAGASASGGATDWDRHERSDTHSRSDWDRPRTEHDRDRSGPDRTERTERSSAPMRDRSFTEYSVSAPGRRRAAPRAWDGTLDGVASRWGTMERPPAVDDEQLQQLDSALARQRQLLAATAAAAAETAERRAEISHDERVPLPRLRTGSWLNDPSTLDRHQFEHDHGDHDPRLADQDPRGWESDPRQRPRETSVRFDGSADNDRYARNAHDDRRGPAYDSPDREYRSGRVADDDRRGSEPRCEEHRALREAEVDRRHHEDERGDERDWEGQRRHQEERPEANVRGAVRRDGRGESVETEQALRRQESLQRREEEQRRDEEERRREEGDRRREEEERRQEEEKRRREEEERRQREEEERRQQEEERRRREEDENRRRAEEERRRQEEEKQRAREAAERHSQPGRKASVTSNVSSNGGKSRGGRASVVSTASGVTASGRPQNGANGGKQNVKKKKNMDWLLGGGGGSSGDSDNGGPGGTTDKPAGGATQAADRPSAASRKSSQGSTVTAAAAAPVPAARRPADTSSSDEAAPSRPATTPTSAAAATAASAAAAATAAVASATAAITGAAPPEKPVKLRLDSGSDSYHLSADLGGDESDDDFWG